MLERNGLEPSQICEVGCGAGGVLVSLTGSTSRQRPLFRLRDLPRCLRSYPGHRRRTAFEFFLADLLDEPVTYELVCCLDVVEHVEDYLGFLRRLRPRGQLKLFHLPLEMTVERLLRPKGFSECPPAIRAPSSLHQTIRSGQSRGDRVSGDRLDLHPERAGPATKIPRPTARPHTSTTRVPAPQGACRQDDGRGLPDGAGRVDRERHDG